MTCDNLHKISYGKVHAESIDGLDLMVSICHLIKSTSTNMCGWAWAGQKY